MISQKLSAHINPGQHFTLINCEPHSHHLYNKDLTSQFCNKLEVIS